MTGLSLALGLRAENREDKIKALTLFATHYFEADPITGEMEGVANASTDALEHGDTYRAFMHSDCGTAR